MVGERREDIIAGMSKRKGGGGGKVGAWTIHVVRIIPRLGWGGGWGGAPGSLPGLRHPIISYHIIS